MAYKQFLTKAKEAGLLNEFSPQDLQIAYEKPEFGMAILGLKQDYKNATTDEGRALAHATAEQLRSEYKHAAVPKTSSPSSATAGAYGNTTGFKDTLAKIEQMNYPTWKQGESYKELEGSYVDAGQRAMQDTLAQVSARTGGIASSYAGGAAQGAYNEYMKQLDEAAYNRYLAERGEMVDLMQMQINADNIEYGKTLDRIAAERDAEATAYERSMAEDSISYERQMLEREQAMETVNNMIAMGATLADIPADLLAKSGYGESYVNVGNADYQRRNAPKPAAGASGVVAAEPIEEEPGYEPYTRKQYDTYTQIATNLAKKAESDENYEPLNYIRMVEKSMGSDYYKNLIGNTLYERLINEMDEYSFGNRQEPEDNYLGAIYNAMMSAEDPEQWLTENAQYLTEDELATALKWLE